MNLDEKQGQFEEMVKAYAPKVRPLDEVKTELAEALQLVFDANRPLGLEFIMLRGYTPGFNDGDPCYHSTTCYAVFEGDNAQYTLEDFGENGWDVPELLAGRLQKDGAPPMGWREMLAYQEESGQRHPINVIEYFMGQGRMANMLERIYDTNFQLAIYTSPEGQVTVDHQEYCCGN